jgi:hypothetical protein
MRNPATDRNWPQSSPPMIFYLMSYIFKAFVLISPTAATQFDDMF